MREARIWASLKHPYILPLIGLPSFNGVPHLMSPYMENGTLDEYVRKHPHANRVQLVSTYRLLFFSVTRYYLYALSSDLSNYSRTSVHA